MKNYLITVIEANKSVRRVVLAGLTAATGVVSTSLQKGLEVRCRPTHLPVTHKNSYAAQQYIEKSVPALSVVPETAAAVH